MSSKRCLAMIAAGIYDPESKDGIDFCISYCPYDKCIVFECGRAIATIRRDKRAAKARDMIAKGISIEDIAQELRVSVRTVQRYLRK